MAYATPGAPVKSARATEYDLFARNTRRLRETRDAGPLEGARRIRALHDNLEMWIVLAAEVSDPENALPPELRARLFYLAEFTQLHTPRVMRGEAKVDILIDLNTAVMRGLADREPGK
jgi:flagellar protein FlaF